MLNPLKYDKLRLTLLLMTPILFFPENSYSQGGDSHTNRKVTWHNKLEDNKATGGLEVFVEPVEADIYLNGELAGRTPLTLERVETGRYEVRVKAEGYSEYRTYVEIVHDQFLVVNAKLSRAHHIAWQQSRMAAIQSSILFPGKGQVDLGYKNRGWTYFFGFAAAGWYAYYSWHKNEDERKNFHNAQTAYLIANNTESATLEYNNMMNARRKMSTHQTQYEYALIAMGGVWLMNMIDVMYISGREPVIEAFGKSIYIIPEWTMSRFSLKLSF